MSSWRDRAKTWLKDQAMRYTMDDWMSWFNFGGYSYPLSGNGIQQTLTGETVEAANGTFGSNAALLFGSNPVVFACEALRANVFAQIRFQWQLMISGRPNMLFGTEALEILERPWANGTTQDLLLRMITDADIGGACYQTLGNDLNMRREIIRLRPDWVDVVMEPRLINGAQAGWRKLGYAYYEGGRNSGNDPVILTLQEVSAFVPMIDPLHNWRGMSWLTPVIREVQSDAQMTTHKQKFFENGASPSMIIHFPVGVKPDQIKEMRKILEPEHAGVDNAYKRLYIGGGADATVVGANFQETTFKEVQGAGETRIAAAAGTPPTLVGLSEGMQGSSLNAGNYSQARRRFADITEHPLWQNVAGSLAILVGPPPPPRSAKIDLGPKDTGVVRLWYDPRDIAFLREDEKDNAEIISSQAQTMRALLDSGFEWNSVVQAVMSEDWGVLKHTGLFSVQLQPPGTVLKDQNTNGNTPTPKPGGKPAVTSGN